MSTVGQSLLRGAEEALQYAKGYHQGAKKTVCLCS